MKDIRLPAIVLASVALAGCAQQQHNMAYAIRTKSVTTPEEQAVDAYKPALVGQAIAASAIYAEPSKTSRVYSEVRPYQLIVLRNSEDPAFFKVLMQNGKYGYVASDRISSAPYQMSSAGGGGDESGSGPGLNALDYVGTPYVNGGTDLSNGVGNGEFVQQVKNGSGVVLPTSPAAQAKVGTTVKRLEYLKPGDRLYFGANDQKNVALGAIYVGKGYMVLADPKQGKVVSSYVGDKGWLKRLIAARRD